MKPILKIRPNSNSDQSTEFKKLMKNNFKLQTFTLCQNMEKNCHKRRLLLKRMKSLFQVGTSYPCSDLLARNDFQAFCYSFKQLPLNKLVIIFRFCNNLSDDMLKLFYQNLKHTSSLTSLSLHFESFEEAEDSKSPTSKGISQLLLGLKPLKFLSNLDLRFPYMPFFDDSYLNDLGSALKNSHSLKNLKLNFSKCPLVSDEGLSNFSSH